MPQSYAVQCRGALDVKPALDFAYLFLERPTSNNQVKAIVEDTLARGIQRIIWWLGSGLVRRGYLQASDLRKLSRSVQASAFKEEAAQDRKAGAGLTASAADCPMASHIRQHGFNNPMGVACIGPGRLVVAGGLKFYALSSEWPLGQGTACDNKCLKSSTLFISMHFREWPLLSGAFPWFFLRAAGSIGRIAGQSSRRL